MQLPGFLCPKPIPGVAALPQPAQRPGAQGTTELGLCGGALGGAGGPSPAKEGLGAVAGGARAEAIRDIGSIAGF